MTMAAVATTASFAAGGDYDTRCTICRHQFQNPKILPCAHVLCRQCLLSSPRASDSTAAGNKFLLCPVCKCAIADLGGNDADGRARLQAVDALPTDTTMEALVRCAHLLGRDRRDCGGCQRAASAVAMCLTCWELMCQACCRVHKNFAATRDHLMEDLTSLTPAKLSSKEPAHCPVHGRGKPLELFCSSYGAALCHVCASTHHRACAEVLELKKAAEKCREELRILERKLLDGELKLWESVAHLETHAGETMAVTEEAMARIDNQYDELESFMRDCRRIAKERALEARSKAERSVLAAKASLLERREKLTSHRDMVARVREAASDTSIHSVTSGLRTRIGGLDFGSSLLAQGAGAVVKVTVAVDPQAPNRIRRELAELFQISVSPAAILPRQ